MFVHWSWFKWFVAFRVCVGYYEDDDNLASENNIIIPFCRKGHSQITGIYINETTTAKHEGILVFGGEGINYYEPHDTYLRDLWALKLRPSIDSDGLDFEWSMLKKKGYNSTSGKNIVDWPERRSSFGSTATRSGILLLYGGQNTNHLYSHPFLGDMWAFIGEQQRWVLLYDSDSTADLTASSPLTKRNPSTSSNSKRPEKPLLKEYVPPASIGTGSSNEIDKESDDAPKQPSTTMNSPGFRKDALLVSLPLTNRVLLLGGDTYKDTYATSDRSNYGVGDFSTGLCMRDVYLFNSSITDLITDVIQTARMSSNSSDVTLSDSKLTWTSRGIFPVRL